MNIKQKLFVPLLFLVSLIGMTGVNAVHSNPLPETTIITTHMTVLDNIVMHTRFGLVDNLGSSRVAKNGEVFGETPKQLMDYRCSMGRASINPANIPSNTSIHDYQLSNNCTVVKKTDVFVTYQVGIANTWDRYLNVTDKHSQWLAVNLPYMLNW